MHTLKNPMRLLALRAVCAAAFVISPLAMAEGEFLPSAPIVLKENQAAKLRGIINVVHLPLPDDLELGKSQSGYFLFTASPCDVKISGEQSGTELVKNQLMFHLVLSEEQMAGVKKLLQKPVEITATPFGAHTRHHRTPVLLEVKSIKLLG